MTFTPWISPSCGQACHNPVYSNMYCIIYSKYYTKVHYDSMMIGICDIIMTSPWMTKSKTLKVNNKSFLIFGVMVLHKSCSSLNHEKSREVKKMSSWGFKYSSDAIYKFVVLVPFIIVQEYFQTKNIISKMNVIFIYYFLTSICDSCRCLFFFYLSLNLILSRLQNEATEHF